MFELLYVYVIPCEPEYPVDRADGGMNHAEQTEIAILKPSAFPLPQRHRRIHDSCQRILPVRAWAVCMQSVGGESV